MSGSSSYSKVSSRGFKLGYFRRFSIQAFRTRFVFLFNVVKQWKYMYCRAIKLVKRGVYVYGHKGVDKRIGKVSEISSKSMNALLVSELFMPRSHACRMRSFGRSESFYSEVIADCLEFIKQTSVADKEEDDKPAEKNSTKTISSRSTSVVAEV